MALPWVTQRQPEQGKAVTYLGVTRLSLENVLSED